MNILNSDGLGAATVVVDIDQLNDELKRLRQKLPRDDRQPAAPEGISPSATPPSGPVHRPSWNGTLRAPSAVPARGRDAADISRFRCGR